MRSPLLSGPLLALAALASPAMASGQLPACDGHDPAGARVELEAGTVLMQDAIAEARRGGDGARSLAARALARFDRQCELGDRSALAERGAALMLMGEPLRSAQSYDAFLRAVPLASLEARTRRRIEANLQPGVVLVQLEGGTARLFVDDLEFGPLPRTGEIRLPLGARRLEARDANGTVLAATTAILADAGEPVAVRLALPGDLAAIEPGASTPTDYTDWYVATGVTTAVALGLGIGFFFAIGERQATYDSICTAGAPTEGCPAVLTERDAAVGLSVTGFILAGLGAVGFAVVAAIDLGQPRLSATVRPEQGGASIGMSGAF